VVLNTPEAGVEPRGSTRLPLVLGVVPPIRGTELRIAPAGEEMLLLLLRPRLSHTLQRYVGFGLLAVAKRGMHADGCTHPRLLRLQPSIPRLP
jgi:hypothetical protein